MDNNEVARYFANPVEADHWVWALNSHVIPWVEAHSRSFLELVRFVSIRRGVLKTGLGREKFGELVIKACPEHFKSTDNPRAIKYSMDKFRYMDDLERFERLGDRDQVKQYADELNDLFDREPEPDDLADTSTPTMSSRLLEFLRKEYGQDRHVRIVERPTYCSSTPVCALEMYVSTMFYNSGQPTFIFAFEHVDGLVDAAKVNQLAGQYMIDPKIKVFIVSTKGFDNQTFSAAKTRNIGLMQVNLAIPITEENIILSREEVSVCRPADYMKMLLGKREMAVPVVVAYGDYIGPSLARGMKDYERPAGEAPPHFDAPMLSCEEIEGIAYEMVKAEADEYTKRLRQVDYHTKDVPYFEISPYLIARKRGLKYRRKTMHNGQQLAAIDFRNHRVTLSDKVKHYSPRERFSMGHEIGHDTLHSYYGLVASAIDDETRKLLERQANHFASCLLMPRELTCLMFEIYWKKEFHEEQVRPLYVIKEARYSSPSFQKIIGPAARHLNVSMDALMWRLHDIGLVVFC